MKKTPLIHWTTALAVVLFSTQLARAQTTYTGTTNGTALWTNSANWSGSSVPNATDAVVVFTNIAVSNGVQWQNTNITVGTINFQNTSGNVVIGDNSVTNDTLTLATSTGKPVLNVSNSGGTAFIYATLLGTNGFTKTGAGNLSFRFNQTAMAYAGDINLNAGTLTINQDSSLGDTNNDIIVGGNSTLSYSPGANSNAASLSAGRNISISNGTTLTLQTLNTNTPLTINGVISNAGGLTFVGAGAGSNAATSLSYTLNGVNTYTGQTTIQGGARVTLGSGAALGTGSLTLANSPGTTNPSFTLLNLGGNSQSVATLTANSSTTNVRTLVISNGSLNVTNPASAFSFNGTNGTSLNMSGLTSFTYNGAAGNRSFTVTPDTVSATATNTNTVFLANTGIASNNISAAAITVGGAAGTSQGGDHQGQLFLGKANQLSANILTLGGFNGSGVVAFQSGITDGALTLRGSNAVGRMGTLIVGATSSGIRSGAGTLNISNGTIDASISNTYIGLYGANSTGPNTASLIAMGGGNFDSLNMVVAAITNTILSNASATTTGTFQQNGGTAKIQTLTLGDSASAGNTNATKSTFIANYNLSSSNATLYAQTIQAGTTTTDYSTATRRKINFGAGTIRNYDASTDLTIQGIDTTSSGRLEIAVASNANTKVFYADAGRKVTLASTAILTSNGDITKSGEGTLVLQGANSISGAFRANQGTLELASASGSAAGSVASVAVATNATLLLSQSDQVNNAASVSLTGGTISRAGGVSEVFGNLTVTGSGFLNYGTGAIGTLSFGTYTPSALLSVQNFGQGNVLTFFGTDLSGSINNGDYFSFDNGFVSDWNITTANTFTITAIPEPSTVLAALGLTGLMLWPARRRIMKDAKAFLDRAPMRDRLARRQ